MNIDLTNSVVYDLNIEKGKTLNKTFKCEVYTGNTFIGYFDFNPYTAATLTVKSSPNQFVKISEFKTSDSTLSLSSNGEFTLSKSANDLSIRSGKYVYDLTLFSSGETRGFLRGKFNVLDQSSAEVPEDVNTNELIRITVKSEYIVTGSTTGGGVNVNLFTGYTATTETRLIGIEEDIIFLSGNSNITASNGLIKSGNNIRLGGSLTGDTYITGQSTFQFGTMADRIKDFSVYASDQNNGIILNSQAGTYIAEFGGYGITLDAREGGGMYISDNGRGGVYLTSDGGGVNIIDTNYSAYLNLKANGTNGSITLDSTSVKYVLGYYGGQHIAKLFDNRTIKKGIEYADDYSTGYTSRSLVDKGYVDSLVSGSSSTTTANNGLQKIGDNIVLGGYLTGDTTIQLTGNTKQSTVLVNESNGIRLTTTTGTESSRLFVEGTNLGLMKQNTSSLSYLNVIDNAVEVSSLNGAIYNAEPTYLDGTLTSKYFNNKNYWKVNGVTQLSGNTTILANPVEYNNIILRASNNVDTSYSNMGVVQASPTTPDASGYAFLYSNKGTSNQSMAFVLDLNGMAGFGGSGMYVYDARTIKKGIEYVADYSSGFGKRSLVDKGYVTGLTSTLGVTANNGLTKTGNNIVLGGSLTGDTIVNGANHSLTLGNSGDELSSLTIKTKNGYSEIANKDFGETVEVALQLDTIFTPTANLVTTNLSTYNSTFLNVGDNLIQIGSTDSSFQGAKYSSDYSSNFTERSLVDKAYVTGLTITKADQLASIVVVGSAYTITNNNSYQIIEVTGSTNSTITIPSGLTNGIQFTINNLMSASTVTISGGIGTTVQLKGTILSEQYDGVSIYIFDNKIRGFGNLST